MTIAAILIILGIIGFFVWLFIVGVKGAVKQHRERKYYKQFRTK